MIPRIIHYAWFGGSPLSELARRCVDSWKRTMPDYEIVRWDEGNFDVDQCLFSKHAYQQKAWAFVSDYARYRILRERGGVFLDADVETLRPFDGLLDAGAFLGFMQNGEYVNPGLGMGACPGHPVMQAMVRRYEQLDYAAARGRIQPLSSPRLLTPLLAEQYGLALDGSLQLLNDGLVIYPADYFDPLDSHTGNLDVADNTHSIHHYAGDWLSPAKRYRVETRKKLAPLVGPKLSWFVSSAASVVKYGKRAF